MKKTAMFKRDVQNIRMEIVDAIVEHLNKSGSTVVKLNRPIFLETDDYPDALNDYINSDHATIERVTEGGWMYQWSDEPNQVIPFRTLTTDVLIALLQNMEESLFTVEEPA